MQNLLRILVFICAVSLTTACKKNTNPPTTASIPPVKSITGTYTIPSPTPPSRTFTEEDSYDYNGSGQLIKKTRKSFVGDNGNLQYEYTDYTYTNGRLTKTTYTIGGDYEFEYNNNGQIIAQKRIAAGPATDQITYNTNGSIAKVVFRAISGIDDPWTYVYNYSANGLLANIVVTPKKDHSNAGTIYFTNYSDECDFEPLIINELMRQSVSFPPFAMNRWKRLPQQIKYISNDGSISDINDYTYTIHDRKIEKMTRVGTSFFNQDPGLANGVKYSYSFSY